MALSGYYFQSLREDDDQDRVPIVLPLAESRIVSEPMRWGSHWTLDSSVLALTRPEGLDTRRLSSRAAWEVPAIGRFGELYRIEASLRGDAYYTEGNPRTFSSTGGTDTTGRLLPRVTTDLSWPLIGDGWGWTYELEPLAQLSLAPEGGNDNDIPNEDSRDFEFDETNLLEPNRFPGLDRVEGGGNLAYGTRFSGFGPRALQISGMIGQNLRIYGSSPFPEGTGLDDQLSDYVGRIDVRPSDWLDLGFRFRLGNDEPELRRSDLGLSVGPSWLRVSLDYLNLSREADALEEDEFDSREEIVLGARAQVTDRLALAGQTRRDLTRSATVAHQLGLLYTHPCLTLLAGFEQSFTTTGEIDDETTLLVRIALRNLGELQTGSFLGL
jgi:LPS-assembly protein